MKKTYQPQVIEIGDAMMQSLVNSNFFEEEGITDIEPGRPIVYDFLTEKFINGQINDGKLQITDEEFTKLLSLVRAECILVSLKNKGFLNSYEDENTEEQFFLTEMGKEYTKNMKKEYLLILFFFYLFSQICNMIFNMMLRHFPKTCIVHI